MRHTALALFLMTGGSIGLQAGYSPLAHAQSAQRPNMALARTAFYRLSSDDRLGLYLMLMATGDYNAMVFDTFGTRLYEGINILDSVLPNCDGCAQAQYPLESIRRD